MLFPFRHVPVLLKLDLCSPKEKHLCGERALPFEGVSVVLFSTELADPGMGQESGQLQSPGPECEL